MNLETIHHRFSLRGASSREGDRESVYRVVPLRTKIRVTVHRDFYRDQSYGKLELWNDTNGGWSRLFSVDKSDAYRLELFETENALLSSYSNWINEKFDPSDAEFALTASGHLSESTDRTDDRTAAETTV
jgi:hypothetical protein